MYTDLIKPLFTDIKTFILDTLFPISCLGCGTEGAFVCVDCKSVLKKLEHQRCIVCQKPAVFGLTHPGCLTPHCADGLISFYDYHDDKVAQIIIKGKYSFLPGAFEELGTMIADKIQNQNPSLVTRNSSLLTPIPLHSTRKRWRGFNQAEILCKVLSAELNLPIADVLQRKKITKTQKDLKKDARLKNIQDAFSINPQSEIRNKQFLLIDDVTTTGATLLEAAKILKRNGAAKVICLTVARD